MSYINVLYVSNLVKTINYTSYDPNEYHYHALLVNYECVYIIVVDTKISIVYESNTIF